MSAQPRAAALRAVVAIRGVSGLTVERRGVQWCIVEERERLLPSGAGRAEMFFGTYTPKLDEKARLFLPARFRDELAEGLVVTRGQERCLYVWSAEEFDKLTERLRQAPVTNKHTRDYVRMLFAGASDATPDKQGRITLAPLLREYASLRLSQDCIVIGAMNRVEIWDPGSWQTYSEQQEQTFADLSEEVFPGVI
jgi:MraZ protein